MKISQKIKSIIASIAAKISALFKKKNSSINAKQEIKVAAPAQAPATEPVNKPATAISVSIVPTNPAIVPAGIFCTRTTKLTAVENITDEDGNTTVKRQWFDNGNLRAEDTTVLTGPFGYGHVIEYKAVADGAVSGSISAKVTCGANYK